MKKEWLIAIILAVFSGTIIAIVKKRNEMKATKDLVTFEDEEKMNVNITTEEPVETVVVKEEKEEDVTVVEEIKDEE